MEHRQRAGPRMGGRANLGRRFRSVGLRGLRAALDGGVGRVAAAGQRAPREELLLAGEERLARGTMLATELCELGDELVTQFLVFASNARTELRHGRRLRRR